MKLTPLYTLLYTFWAVFFFNYKLKFYVTNSCQFLIQNFIMWCIKIKILIRNNIYKSTYLSFIYFCFYFLWFNWICMETQNAVLEFVRVISAKKQVVSGTLYYITLEANDGVTKKVYETKVLEKPWLNIKEVQEFKPITVAVNPLSVTV